MLILKNPENKVYFFEDEEERDKYKPEAKNWESVSIPEVEIIDKHEASFGPLKEFYDHKVLLPGWVCMLGAKVLRANIESGQYFFVYAGRGVDAYAGLFKVDDPKYRTPLKLINEIEWDWQDDNFSVVVDGLRSDSVSYEKAQVIYLWLTRNN